MRPLPHTPLSPLLPLPRPTEHEERQIKLRALRNRQDLCQEEGILNLILDAIDKITVITSEGYLVSLAGEESGQMWDIISNYLYQLLGERTQADACMLVYWETIFIQ